MRIKQSGKNYFPAAQKSALLTLFKDSTYIEPVSASFNKKQNTITLQYTNGCVANIGITNGGAYLKFVLQSLQPRNDIQAVVWGPYSTTIQESIGETICVVHDEQFALGMQSLDMNTIEGLPEGNDDAGGGSYIDPLPHKYLPDSLKDQIGKQVEVNVNVTGDMPGLCFACTVEAQLQRNSYGRYTAAFFPR
ncbi:MAG: hypothetical protein QM802_20215 [Agriterribacter sp.]